jgi:RNA polymerase sigma factor (sigma-70 family)
MLDNSGDVEDVVMDAFVSTSQRIDSLDNPGGYLRTAVVNGCRQRLRDGSRRQGILAARVAPFAEHRVGADVDASLEVREMIDSLSERERTVMVLTYYLDLPHSEAASIMGCSVGTVKSLVHRAKRSLREEWVT